MLRIPHVLVLMGTLALAAATAWPSTARGQLVPRPPITQQDWQLRTVRQSGQPVIPIFEGWYPEANGTYSLCFGFFSLNRSEALHIPVGPDNFIEPARFNGNQPTHFSPLGPDVMTREYCVFTVNVPSDIADERVWWNLQVDGHTYRVPGHITARPWRVDNLVNSVAAASMGSEAEAPVAGSLVAPVVALEGASGGEARGKSGATAGELTARAGSGLPITISVALPEEDELGDDLDPDEEGVLVRQLVKWTKFTGPEGAVRFSRDTIEFELGPAPVEQTVMATFEEPGNYTLLAQVLSGSFSSQCCWTNAYVNVTVDP